LLEKLPARFLLCGTIKGFNYKEGMKATSSDWLIFLSTTKSTSAWRASYFVNREVFK